MNVRAYSLIRKSSCCRDAKEKEICKDDFLFRATREYTEAGIEQRCIGANSTEPRRHGDRITRQRAEDQQLYNRPTMTSWAHRWSLSKRRELVLSSLATRPSYFC